MAASNRVVLRENSSTASGIGRTYFPLIWRREVATDASFGRRVVASSEWRVYRLRRVVEGSSTESTVADTSTVFLIILAASRCDRISSTKSIWTASTAVCREAEGTRVIA